jgi:uncharacterized protein (DUF58 family)
MDKSDLFAKLRVLQFKPRFRTSNRYNGANRSTLKGRGMSFSEVREYQFGDEVRTIDWNVTARYNVPHVKIFEEEKEQHYLIVLDASSSSFFADNQLSKWDKQVEAAALIAFTAWKQNDHVGLVIFSDKIDLYVPLSKGRQHFYQLLDKLLAFRPRKSRTLLDLPFNWLSEEKIPRCTVFFMSDFLSSLSIEPSLKKVQIKHQVVFLCIRHENELTMPDAGWLQVENMESGRKTWINTSSRKTKLIYEEFFRNQQSHLEHLAKMTGIKMATISSESNTFNVLNALVN